MPVAIFPCFASGGSALLHWRLLRTCEKSVGCASTCSAKLRCLAVNFVRGSFMSAASQSHCLSSEGFFLHSVLKTPPLQCSVSLIQICVGLSKATHFKNYAVFLLFFFCKEHWLFSLHGCPTGSPEGPFTITRFGEQKVWAFVWRHHTLFWTCACVWREK